MGHTMRSSLRRIGCGGGGSAVGSRHFRGRFLLAALVTSAAVAVFVAFGRPFGDTTWSGDHYIIPSSRSTYDSHFSADFPTSPPTREFVSISNSSVSTANVVLPPVLAPSPSRNGVLDDAEMDDGSPDLKETPLWKEVANTTDANVPPFLVEPHSSPLENSAATNVHSDGPELRMPPLQVQVTGPLTSTDQQLVYAKGEISRAPIVFDDPELYAPLFLNVSVFKRSYELMENILKVYIYQDGSKPIFHRPQLKGIYASEGWFMKLMEENKSFIVKDPNKAHLFYLPYSAHRLEQALYVPNSHNIQPLLIFLRNYVNMISVKYPFWNRTRGADHFLVACHDWGPYTTKWHHELLANTIKALCNADVSEGIFIRGKDVSLPETSIRNPRRPLRNIGGKPASQRTILAFYAGQMHGRVRPILLQYWKGRNDDMKIYGLLPKGVARKMSYAEHMKSSKFCICPMGYEVNSPRIVEAIYYECVPVIIADNFVLPFEEVLDWSAFSVIVAEKDIVNLKDILLKIPQRQYATMQMNVKKLQKHFLWHSKPVKYDIFYMILHSIWFNRLNHIQTEQ
ncbi:putative glycosyltransferase isoform X1 [Canna indica]|uniref:Glycosyltransferase isoform X1 n=1 Tax=Canna indica TaxID=4628 RepID=A0AAQ3JQU1_9LILI|nr:putative glycosyltransferase isoform X1 [Canna indica]